MSPLKVLATPVPTRKVAVEKVSGSSVQSLTSFQQKPLFLWEFHILLKVW